MTNSIQSQGFTSTNWLVSLTHNFAKKIQLSQGIIARRVLRNSQPVLVDQSNQIIEPKNISSASGFFVLGSINTDKSKQFPGKGKAYNINMTLVLSKFGDCSLGWWLAYADLLRGSGKSQGISGYDLNTGAIVTDTISIIGLYFPKYVDNLAAFGTSVDMVAIELQVKVYGCKTEKLAFQ